MRESWDEWARMVGKNEELLSRFILLVLLLTMGWIGFIFLIGELPTDTNAALLMVWLSIAVLIGGMFPAAFESIKRFKVGNVEVELFESVKGAAMTEFASIPPSPLDPWHSEKGDLRNLEALLREIKLHPERPILLTVNLERTISIPTLYLYLYYLILTSNSVTVMFVSQPLEFESTNAIREKSIVKIIDGHLVARELRGRFPGLPLIISATNSKSILNSEDKIELSLRQEGSNYLRGLREALVSGFSEDFFEVDTVSPTPTSPGTQLTQSQVLRWFGHVNKHMVINQTLTSAQFKAMLKNGVEYLVRIQGDTVVGLSFVCDVTVEFSKRAIPQED